MSGIAMALLLEWRQAQEDYRAAWRWGRLSELEFKAALDRLIKAEAEVCFWLRGYQQDGRIEVSPVVLWADEEGGLHEGPRGDAWRCSWTSEN